MAQMTTIFVGLQGPETATTEDLINGGREAVARAGYQVGDFELVQEVSPGVICGNLEADRDLYRESTRHGKTMSWTGIDCVIEAP